MSDVEQHGACEHLRCGGCGLLQLSLTEQLAHKRKYVELAFAPHRELRSMQVQVVQAAEPAFAYRTRAKLVVSRSGEIGLYARGTHDVVDIPKCLVLAPSLLAVVAALRLRLKAQPVPLMGIDLREVRSEGAEGVLVTLIGNARDTQKLSAFGGQLLGESGVLGVALSVREARAPQLLGDVPVPVVGVDVARDRMAQDAPYHYATYGAFVQAHRGQAQALSVQVGASLRSALGTLERSRVLELYAGSGALGLWLAKQGALVVSVERYAPALELVSRAAEEQHLSGVATRLGDVDHVLSDLLAAHERYDAVLVNPPRRGLPPSVRRGIARLGPKAIVYVSCDPYTLARDLADFARLGFASAQVMPFDMMPQSQGVENVVCLLPLTAAAIEVLYEDDELVVVDKPPHLPSIPEAEYPHSLLERLRAQLGVAELFAVHRLDVGTSGVCLFAKHSARVAGLSQALAAGQKHYTALVRGIAHNKGIVKVPLSDAGVPREAVTRFTRKQIVGGHSLVRVRPEQGRLHQVRRHLASIGRPVLGDARYGDPASNRHFEHKHGLDRAFLHLSRIELVHPGSGQKLRLEAALPGDLSAVLASIAATSDTARDARKPELPDFTEPFI